MGEVRITVGSGGGEGQRRRVAGDVRWVTVAGIDEVIVTGGDEGKLCIEALSLLIVLFY